ncbi:MULTISPECIES: cold shock domain-containing protein [Halomonadaceae]|jgi:CspA family cold shock protein|uniref:Cold shock protein (Beta-ribbon, CspA family) n=1 Tax=Vreelandella subterranea TaxID=416874 RepID=A0A1H9U909_9GAMM|nr:MULTISPECIES: cold shock domain-containing protein [Halomonas]SES05634.1 cold shock protein (beta-ribbon, CspA family) [Halomonas subterranea]
MNPKVVFRSILISILLAAPTPLLLAGIVHLTDAPLAEQWLAELAVTGAGGIYIAVAIGSFIVLCIATLATAALAPPVVVSPTVRSKPAPRQSQAPATDEDEDLIDPNDGREEGEVKWFNTNKGYGFITRDNGDDVFVHFRAIRGRGPRMLAEGQIVRYHVIKNERGLQADDVSIIE